MINTSSYDNWQSDKYTTYSISGDCGKGVNYQGRSYPKLAPKRSFWEVWHNNIGKVPEEENNRYYVYEYWNQVLSKLDPEDVYRELSGSVLLCYEPNTLFCHRHIVAAWFELLLGIKVFEQKAKDYKIEKIERPIYIKQYLEDAMRYNRNMRGFNSLRALYLFEKSEKIDNLANELEEKDGKCYDEYRQIACYLRCDADEEEANYNNKYTKKMVKKIIM